MTLEALRLLAAFEVSVREHDQLGAAPPEAWRDIEQDFQESKAMLVAYIEKLEQR